jgi:Protein of unknown function (DUF2934)
VTKTSQDALCLRGCEAVVPPEIRGESLCVLHFVQSIEQACNDVRREMSMEEMSIVRVLEIRAYIKSTAMKLSEIATGKIRLSDDLKNRVLTNLLALMNLQEGVARCQGTPIKRETRGKRAEDISRRAYELYVQRGGEPGRDVEDWISAENELRIGNPES